MVKKTGVGFLLSLMTMVLLTQYRKHDAFIIMLLLSTLIDHGLMHQWPHHLIKIPHHIHLNVFAFQYPHSLPWSSTLSLLLALLLMNLLDSSATLYSLADTAGLLKKQGINCQNPEGRPKCDWIIVDVGNVIIHLFQSEIRELYSLEKLWDISFDSLKNRLT